MLKVNIRPTDSGSLSLNLILLLFECTQLMMSMAENAALGLHCMRKRSQCR